MESNGINWTIIIVIILVVIIIWYFFRRLSRNVSNQNQPAAPSQNSVSSVDQFRYEQPKKEFVSLVSEFGKPDVVANKPYGVAMWKNKGFYDLIMILDESIQHNYPKPHCDFLYTIITVHIPNNLVCLVLNLSDSITYDKLKNQLTARCHFMGANVVTLLLALKIVADPDNFEAYKSKYNELIAVSTNKQDYLVLQDQLGALITENRNKYNQELAKVNLNCMIR